MVFAGYRLNIDALLARIIYRWHWKVALSLAICITLLGLLTGRIPPIWRGIATLIIEAAPGATVTVDGQSWPYQLYAGIHQIAASLPDGRRAWATVNLSAGETLTMTLPSGLVAPRERILPAAAPGLQVEQVWWADRSWRILSKASTPMSSEQSSRETPVPVPPQTVAVNAYGVERLITIDAYAGLADQVHIDGTRIEAVYIPKQLSDNPYGVIELHGWDRASGSIQVTAPLTLLRFSPTGETLLFAEQTTSDSEQLFMLGKNGERTPLVAIPGHSTRLSWRDDGQAVVVHTRQGERLTLTLVRLQPTIAAAVIAELDSTHYASDLVPLTWDASGLLWVMPEEEGSFLWRASLTTLIPERSMPVMARAIALLPNGDLRAVIVENDQLVIGRYRGQHFIGETAVAQIPPSADLVGIWHDDQLLLQSAGRAWLLDLAIPAEKEIS